MKMLRNDVNEMEAMLSGYLDFARGLGQEKPEDIDLKDFVQETISKLKGVKFEYETQPIVQIRAAMIRRAISNLVNNALKYGNKAWLTLTTDGERVYLHIDDDGPGIPPEKRSEAFKAFQRLDEARNQNVEGVGAYAQRSNYRFNYGF